MKGTFRLVADASAEPLADGPEPLAGDTPWPDEPDLGLAYPSDFEEPPSPYEGGSVGLLIVILFYFIAGLAENLPQTS